MSEGPWMPAMWIGDFFGMEWWAVKVSSAPSLREDERTILWVMRLLMKLLGALSICLLFQVTLNKFQSNGFHKDVPFFNVVSYN